MALRPSCQAVGLLVVNTGHFSFSRGSKHPVLGIQCYFLWLWTLSALNFKAKAGEKEGVGRLGHLANDTIIGAHKVIFGLFCLSKALCFRAKKVAGKPGQDSAPEPTCPSLASPLKVKVALEMKSSKKEIPT